ncbi:MAG: calcium/sodium antiporter [candidate division WOR-3 bacterium]|nr:MAG: calcium/sodium antiporter [candidate division WOR-3 bacterium]
MSGAIPDFVSLPLGLVLLVLGAEMLVRGASALAARLRVSELAVGLTVVAFGTSMPELSVSLFASAAGRPEVLLGNAIGSNLFNVLVILGVSAVVFPLAVQRRTVRREIPLSLAATALVLLMAFDNSLWPRGLTGLSRLEGAVLLALFAAFLWYIARSLGQDLQPAGVARTAGWLVAVLTGGGLLLLTVGGRLVVDGAVGIARTAGISDRVVSLTVVSAGTSLPEFATSVVAAARRKPDISVGNVVGSNIFNLTAALGLGLMVRPSNEPRGSVADLLVLVAATAALMLAMLTGGRRRLDRWEGVLFVFFYAGYVVWLLFGQR